MTITLPVPSDLREGVRSHLVPESVTIQLDPKAIGGCIVSGTYGDRTHVNEGERVAITLLLRRIQELESRLAERATP